MKWSWKEDLEAKRQERTTLRRRQIHYIRGAKEKTLWSPYLSLLCLVLARKKE
jgi:hypothetical protein